MKKPDCNCGYPRHPHIDGPYTKEELSKNIRLSMKKKPLSEAQRDRETAWKMARLTRTRDYLLPVSFNGELTDLLFRAIRIGRKRERAKITAERKPKLYL